MTELLAGLVLGVAGSAHCVAMCGPLVVAVGRGIGPRRGAQLHHALTYHTGRVLLYALLGLLAGAAGQSLRLAGLGRIVAVTSGCLLIAAAVAQQQVMTSGLAGKLSSLIARLVVAAHRWGVTRPLAGPLATGAVNGLLPCGLTYAALTAALALGSTTAAVIFMSGFGLGTVPALVGVAMGAAAIPPAVRVRLRRIAPAALAILGALLIARGLISHTPTMERQSPVAIHAH